MHHGSLENPETVTAKLYRILTASGHIGRWQDPLSLVGELKAKHGIVVMSLSTWLSSIRLQLKYDFPDWGEELQGPRDAQPTDEERAILGKGNFYRVRKLVQPRPPFGQLPLGEQAETGAQQYSPPTIWQGQGRKTDAVAESQAVAFRSFVRPIQGAAAPTGAWGLLGQYRWEG